QGGRRHRAAPEQVDAEAVPGQRPRDVDDLAVLPVERAPVVAARHDQPPGSAVQLHPPGEGGPAPDLPASPAPIRPWIGEEFSHPAGDGRPRGRMKQSRAVTGEKKRPNLPETTTSGIPIRDHYGEPPPGTYPFTRGITPEGYRSRFWTMRQYAGYGSARESN